MKFLCPNCKAKYRIGPEKMAGRQAAKIRCRKCEYLIQIAYRTDSDEFDVTATPPTIPPTTSASRAAKAAGPLPPVPSPGRSRLAALDVPEGIANKKPTAAVPGLPGLGSAKSTRGAALLSDPSSLGRRPLAPLPPPPMASANASSAGVASLMALPGAGSHTGIVAAVALPSPSAPPGAVPVSLPLPAPAPAPRPSSNSTQLGDQFRESVQASGTEDLPQEGWFVGVNGVPLGPIPLGDLRELAVAGHIDRRSLVWREGQAEWRPLGKFPGLSRVIDDGASPSPLPEAPSVPAAAPAVSNGSNGHADLEHLASGFDVPRADAGERPSVWGDLDDEDDDDEQPTTVKGRVSIMPSSTSLPAPVPPAPAASVPPVSGPVISATLVSSAPPVAQTLLSSAPPAQPMSSRPFGMTGSVSAIPGLTPPPPAVGISGMGGPTIGMAVESSIDTDAALMRPSGRNRWYVIVAAIIFAFALGAIVMHLVWSSGPDKPGQSAVPAPPASGSRVARSASEDELPPGPAETSLRRAPEPSHQPASDTILGATAALRPASAPVPSRATRSANGSLLSGLISSKIAGPSSGGAPEGRATGSGLDATAVQRTVRRYSPAVRQNCWQRALDARAPGVPTSAKVVASITVDPSGRVQAVSVSGAPKGYPGLSRCIESSVKGWQFPRAASQTVTSATFNFIG